MTLRTLKGLLAVCAIVALPLSAHAQEAVITGTLTDSTGASCLVSR
jgi:hypothetical protein